MNENDKIDGLHICVISLGIVVFLPTIIIFIAILFAGNFNDVDDINKFIGTMRVVSLIFIIIFIIGLVGFIHGLTVYHRKYPRLNKDVFTR